MNSVLKQKQTILAIGIVGLSLSIRSGALAATPGIDSLKQQTIASFLQKANNPSHPLYKKLVELNSIDGRNPQGIFPKKLTAKDIHVIPLDGQDQFGSYCDRIEGKLDRFTCSQGIDETYLILIPSRMGVRKATEYRRFSFIVKAAKKVEWQRDENDKQFDRRESLAKPLLWRIEIGNPIYVPTEKLIPALN